MRVFNVPLGNDLCDVTAQWILQTSGQDPLTVSSTILLLPNNRAIKAMTEAFVRHAAPGLLLPRMVAVGDMQLDEVLGPLLDPIASEDIIWPVIGSFDRLMLLARLVQEHRPQGTFLSSAEALRLAGHWQRAYGQLLTILPAYRAELAARKLMGPAERRNKLLAGLERRLAERSFDMPIIAVGITTSAKAVAKLLRRVALIPNGQVILPGVDLELAKDRWDSFSAAVEPENVPTRRRNFEVHPQFHLKHLLDLMGIDRSEIDTLPTARVERVADTISEIFCLPEHSVGWQELAPSRKALSHTQWFEADDSALEAKAIAVRIRGELEQAEKRIALITPDRELAVRVAAQLRRWDIYVDDSAGIPLLQTPNGSLALALVDAISGRFSGTSVLAIAKHPLVFAGPDRLDWLDKVRLLDLELRGAANGVGLSAITRRLENARKVKPELVEWWQGFVQILAPLENVDGQPFRFIIDALRDVA
ncbi:MAG: double-strand break repair protein AddB, partial [Sphingomonadales bacterium]|nr:double-strand break repair protein AddB [Sphingomonadales bacterium]